jgi:penicillin amidase
MKRFLRPRMLILALCGGVGVAAGCGDSESVNPLTGGGGGGAEPTSSTTTTAHGGNTSTSTHMMMTSSGAQGGGGCADCGGHVSIPGLTQPVQAVYDQQGALHVSCSADDDCFAALGYLHAQNRFFFMDFVRNLVRGSLGSLVSAGQLVLKQDYVNRLFFTTRSGDPLETSLYQQVSPETKGHLDSYTNGVNAWIADMRAGRNGATLSREYDFTFIVKSAIRDWEPEDSAAVGLYVLNDLSNDSADEIANGAEVPVFEPSIVADVFSPAPTFDAFTVTAANMPVAPPHPLAPELFARLAPHASMLAGLDATFRGVGGLPTSRSRGDRGSNNWVVGPAHSSTGNALLGNDPHLLLSNPSIWFPAEIDAVSNGSGTYHMAGGTFPGLPCVFIGHNEKIGWGVTTAYWDLADVYTESLTSDNASVNFNGGTVPLISKDYIFQDVSTGTPVTKTFQWVPHHGPLVSSDTTAHTGVSVRWRGHDGGTDLDAFFAVDRAATVDEAKSGLATYATSANQNFVVVDGQGNIGWFPYSQVPTRPWASLALPPWLPLPGDGSAEWGAPVPFDQLPQLENPPAGLIATANNEMTGASADGDPFNDGQAALQSWSKADGTRVQRILDMLATNGDANTVDTIQAMQGDTYSLYASVVVPELTAVASDPRLTADGLEVASLLTDWQYTCPTGLDGTDPMTSPVTSDSNQQLEAAGCMAFHTALFALGDDALGDELAAAGIHDTSGFGLEFIVRALRDPTSVASGDVFWDDVSTPLVTETKADIMVAALNDAGAVLATIGTSDAWIWGRYHTLTLRSIYDNFGVTDYNYGPFAAQGGLYTVDVANPDIRTLLTTPEGDFSFENGPSIRIQVEATMNGTPTMRYELPGGEDLHDTSPFYNNLLPNWLSNTPVAFPFGPGAVQNPAQIVTLTP